MSLNLAPTTEVSDVRDVAVAYAEASSEDWPGLAARADDPNLVGSEFGLRATPDIFGQRDQFQVFYVDTGSIPTEMINLEVARDRTMLAYPRDAMRQFVTEQAIACGIPIPDPDVATAVPVNEPSLIEPECLQPRIVTVDESKWLPLDVAPLPTRDRGEFGSLAAAAFAEAVAHPLILKGR